MELLEAIHSTHTCREYREDQIPTAVLRRVIDAARFAPSGGNRQPVRFIAVTDAGLKSQLKDLYLPHWKAYLAGSRNQDVRINVSRSSAKKANAFANSLERIPVLMMVCAYLADCHATDVDLGRLSVVGGASIYPTVQNLLLAARAEGLGTALTTLLCREEPKVKALLSIPADVSVAATVAMGYPRAPFPNKLTRLGVADLLFDNRWGQPCD